jgi:hypothetical protein
MARNGEITTPFGLPTNTLGSDRQADGVLSDTVSELGPASAADTSEQP